MGADAAAGFRRGEPGGSTSDSPADLSGEEPPPRVLMVMHLPASLELGGARGQLELADVLREHGCEVEVMDRAAILGGRRGGRLGVSPDAFAAAAVRRVRAVADRFDVIDAHQGNLPFSKRRLGFDGLLVVRSVGLAPLYDDFVREAQSRWPTSTNARLFARPLRRWRKRRFLAHVARTFRLGDLIIVPNRDEKEYLANRLGAGEKTVVLPLGLSEKRLRELGGLTAGRVSTGPSVAFIGDWNARKGSHDWPDIFARVRGLRPDAEFTFLGTHVDAGELADQLGVDEGERSLRIVPSYDSAELCGLLEGVRAGALPSYIEGLGLGVLEKMAAGIPSVCYDVPGPRETIGRVDPSLLVPAGDTAAFAARLVELLALDDSSYGELSQRCRTVAESFSWRLIGRETLSAYREHLRMLRAPGSAPAR